MTFHGSESHAGRARQRIITPPGNIAELPRESSAMTAAEARAHSPKSSMVDLALKLGAKLVGKNFSSALDEMQAVQWLPAEQLRKRSQDRLAALLRHAATHVPFYRNVCRGAGVRPEELTGLAHLAVFPVLGKADYREKPAADFVADNVPAYRRIERSTSGSTGEPLAFSLDRNALPVIFASHLFYDSWIGLRPFDRYVRIVSPPGPVPPAHQAPAGFRVRQEVTRRLQQLYEGYTQRKLPVWEVDSRRAIEIFHEIEKFRPAFILGYTSALADIGDELRSRGMALTGRPRGVITVAEALTPVRRSAIERYFLAPITNRYGLRELGSWSAQSCTARPESFHINTELVVCEILRDDGSPAPPGETGRVVLTDLWNFARPFIRYFTGDLAMADAGPCACGRGFPLMGPIDGRSQECLRTVSGKIIGPTVLGHYLFVYHDHHDAIREYQLVQETRDQVRLSVVPTQGWRDGVGELIQNELENLLGKDMAVRIEKVAEIPPDKSGKRPIIKILEG
jgi:phenylacetate-CoA ligase